MRIIDNRASVLFACWNRFTDEHGDKRETGYAWKTVSLTVYDASGRFVGSGKGSTNDVGEGSAEIMELSGISGVFGYTTALKVVGETTVNGKPLKAVTYSVYSERPVESTAAERMYLILTDAAGDIVTDVKASDIKVTDAKSIDTSALSGGVLILSIATGSTATISIGANTFSLSQPIGVRVVPVSLN